MSIARPHPDAAPLPPSERVGRDRRVLRRVVDEHVTEVRDKLEQIAALVRSGELDACDHGRATPESRRYERLRDALDGCLPALERFLDDR